MIKKCWILLFLPLMAWASNPDVASKRGRLCENLLQTEKADVQLPLQPELLEKLLLHFYDLKIFDQRPLASETILFQKAEGSMRDYLREILNSLEGHPSVFVRDLKKYFYTEEPLKILPVELVNKKSFRHSEANEIQSFFNNEISKLPQSFQDLFQKQGRRFSLTLDPQLLHAVVQRSRAVFIRNWREPWEIERSAIIGTPQKMNVMLIEVLKNLDEACKDETGTTLSEREDFLKIWRDTEFRSQEGHLQVSRPVAFSELGSWYYDSPQSREQLHDLYPQGYNYFSLLSDCSNFQGSVNSTP